MKPILSRKLRTFFTSKLTPRWFAHLAVVELLIFCIVVLPSLSAKASFTDANGDFTIWAEAGRAHHGFAIEEVDAATGERYNVGTADGLLLAPGGARITGNYSGDGTALVIRDTTTNETALLPDGAGGNITIPPGTWSGSNAIQTLYFAVPADRFGHSFVVRHSNGTTYVASTTLIIQWNPIQGVPEMICMGWALFDPAQSFRIIDLTTNEQFAENETLALYGTWEALPSPPPVHPVSIFVDAALAGGTFTVHSMVSGGVEMLQSVTPDKQTDQASGLYETVNGNSYQYESEPMWAISAVVGEGMTFWITRDVDGADPQTVNNTRFVLDPSLVGGTAGLCWGLYGAFPPQPTVPMSFYVAMSLSENLQVLQPGGTSALTPVDGPILSIPDGDYSGNDHSFYYRVYTANVIPGQPYWVGLDASNLLTTNPYEHWVWNGWTPLGGTPPPVVATDEISLLLPQSRVGHSFTLFRGNPDGIEAQNRASLYVSRMRI